jgi:hypothetical protein
VAWPDKKITILTCESFLDILLFYENVQTMYLSQVGGRVNVRLRMRLMDALLVQGKSEAKPGTRSFVSLTIASRVESVSFWPSGLNLPPNG